MCQNKYFTDVLSLRGYVEYKSAMYLCLWWKSTLLCIQLGISDKIKLCKFQYDPWVYDNRCD